MFTGEDLGTVDDLHTFSLSIEAYSGRSLLVPVSSDAARGHKHAVIYGGGGAIGDRRRGARSRAEGAIVHAPDARGGRRARRARRSTRHAASLPRIDISFNSISHGDVQGTRIDEMSVADYVEPWPRQVPHARS